jgi:hypothetical protein
MQNSSQIEAYRASLLETLREFDDAEANDQRLEEEIRARRAERNAGRQKARVALESYEEWLASIGQPAEPQASFVVDATPQPQMTLAQKRAAFQAATRDRVGPKRRAVLEALAFHTKTVRRASTKVLASETSLPSDFISNVLWDSVKRGLAVRDGEFVSLTNAGFELLKRIGWVPGVERMRAGLKDLPHETLPYAVEMPKGDTVE